MAHANSLVYQFKIILMECDRASIPVIWRRIQVPSNYNFKQLHVAIQRAMGWESVHFDYHMHQFKMTNPQTGVKAVITKPDPEDEDSASFSAAMGYPYTPVTDEKKAKIAKFFVNGNSKAKYEYDFGDCWDHEIILENILPAQPNISYPVCIAGERHCPPEDSHGVYGYKQLLARGNLDFDPD